VQRRNIDCAGGSLEERRGRSLYQAQEIRPLGTSSRRQAFSRQGYSKEEDPMKKLISVALGISLALFASTASFAAETKSALS